MKRGWIVVAAGLAVAALRCSDPAKPEASVPEPPAMAAVSGPASVNAPPQIAQKAGEILTYFNFVQTTLGDLSGSDPAVNSNIYLWEIPTGSGTIVKKIKAVRRSDGSVDWTVVLNGQLADSTRYNDRQLFIGKAAEDNRSQSWTFYDLLTGAITHKISWNRDKNGALQLDDTFAALNAVWHLDNARDGSGSYSFTLGGVKQFTATWRGDGSGSFVDHTSAGAAESGE